MNDSYPAPRTGSSENKQKRPLSRSLSGCRSRAGIFGWGLLSESKVGLAHGVGPNADNPARSARLSPQSFACNPDAEMEKLETTKNRGVQMEDQDLVWAFEFGKG